MMKNFRNISLLALLALGIWLYVKRRNPHKAANANEKVLEMFICANIKGMDPACTSDNHSCGEMAKVYEGLLTYHYLKRPYELTPNLAAAMPTVSDDQLVYTFKLKQGVKFHDNACFPGGKGRELVAGDFVYSIKRIADSKVQSPGFYLLDGKIKGLNEWREKYLATPAAYHEPVEGLQAIDKYTLQFILTKPCPQFLYILAKHICFAVPQEAVQHYGPAFLNHPVGTGPFMLEEFKPQANKIVYHKHPNFRVKRFPAEASEAFKHLLADAGKQLPLVDQVVMHIIPEEHPRWLKFQKGQLDYIQVPKDEFAEAITPAKGLSTALQQKEVQYHYGLSLSTSFIAFNHLKPLFRDNLKLRRAMSLAYDRQALNELFYHGTSLVAQSIIPPGLAGYRPDYVNPYGNYDLARAKQLLAEAGYPRGKGLPTLTLDTSNSTTHRQIAEHFARCMEKLGIKIEVITNPWPALLQKVLQSKSTMLYTMGWTPGYPDAEYMLHTLYGPNKNGANGSNFDDAAYNVLYEQVRVMPDSPARTKLYEKMNRLAAEKVPLIYMVHRSDHVLHHSWLQNYVLSDFDYYGQEQYLNLDVDKKHTMEARF